MAAEVTISGQYLTPPHLQLIHPSLVIHVLRHKTFCFGRNLAEQTAGIGI